MTFLRHHLEAVCRVVERYGHSFGIFDDQTLGLDVSSERVDP